MGEFGDDVRRRGRYQRDFGFAHEPNVRNALGRVPERRVTGRAVSDANVSAVTKRSAPEVITTSTVAPRCTSVLASAAAL